MKKIALILGICLAFTACSKAYVPSIELALDYSDELGGMVLTKSDKGKCFIHITSNTDWRAKLVFPEGQPSWCSLGATSGNNEYWIPFDYEANTGDSGRTVFFQAETSSKKAGFTITQPHS